MRFQAFYFICVFSISRLSAGIILSTTCPKSLSLDAAGLCRYEIRYLKQAPQTGLQKPFEVTNDGFPPKVIDLGRLLFFDPVLSRDQTMSCAHCHQPTLGLSDGKQRSVGKNGSPLSRSAPSLWNVAFTSSLFWDGRARSLELQARGPLFSPKEMNNSPQRLERTLNAIPLYRKLFREAFGIKRITTNDVVRALTTFERTLISFESRFDAFAYGDPNALSAPEMRGFGVFRSFVTRCTECHTPPLFTNHQLANVGAPDLKGEPEDFGAGAIHHNAKMNGTFRVPTLRNIAKTAPYMHSGVFQALEDVIHFYNLGAGRGPLGKPSRFTHWHIREMGLDPSEERDIVAFLGSLTDERNLPALPRILPSGLSLGLVNRTMDQSMTLPLTQGDEVNHAK